MAECSEKPRVLILGGGWCRHSADMQGVGTSRIFAVVMRAHFLIVITEWRANGPVGLYFWSEIAYPDELCMTVLWTIFYPSLPVRLSVFIYIFLFVCPSCLSVLFVRLSVCLSICLSVRLSAHCRCWVCRSAPDILSGEEQAHIQD